MRTCLHPDAHETAETNTHDITTGLMVVNGENYQSDDYKMGSAAGKYIEYDGRRWYCSEAAGSSDMNKGDGSGTPYLALFYTRDGNTSASGTPLTSLAVTANTTDTSLWTKPGAPPHPGRPALNWRPAYYVRTIQVHPPYTYIQKKREDTPPRLLCGISPRH